MKKKIYVKAPCLSQSGYGEQSRFALRALRSKEDIFDIYIEAIPWGQTGWIWEDNEFKNWVDKTIEKTAVAAGQQTLMPDISLQITIPNEWSRIAPINVGYTAGIETSHVAPVWLQKGNEMDKILVVSEHAKSSYVNTVANAKNQQTGETFDYKLETPVEVVHERTVIDEPENIEGFDLTTDFNFLVVGQYGPRKNLDNTIKWWVEEFFDQDVGLVLKCSMMNNSIIDRQRIQQKVESILAKYEDRKCKVYVLHGDLTNGQMAKLYTHDKIKCLINIAHGEGFGLPLFEAASLGLPIVTVGWSGQQDFLVHNGKNYFTDVEYTLKPISDNSVWDGVLERGSLWAYAEQGSYKMALRRVKNNWEKAKNLALELQEIVNKEFSKEKLYEQFCDSIYKPSTEYLDWMNELDDAEEL